MTVSWKPLIGGYGNILPLLKQATLTNTTFLNVHISPFQVEKYLSYKNYLPAPATVSREKMGFSAVL